ncbi:MAG TPA: VOC family protein [Candidatus Rubrimentiphilum sp.]|nr:VOC family protein [Candidatus Rubrimentiphilum sp.]
MTNTPDGFHTITPRLIAADPAKLVQFLIEVFGATGDYEHSRPSEMKIGDSIIMVSDGGGVRKPTRSLLYVYVDDTDATYQRALKAGATSIEQPQQQPYGDRRAMITDPSGNDWQIATYSQRKQ